MNWADLLKNTGVPAAQGYASYQPENASVGTEVSASQAPGLDVWQQFIKNPRLREILMKLLMKGQSTGGQ